MAERGYYSLIQFMPNPGRAEGANVGLVLVCPEQKRVTVNLSVGNEAPKRLFRASSFDDVRLAIAKESLAARLRSDLGRDPTLEGLHRARALEANSLVLTEPRAVAVPDDPEVVAQLLSRELVHLEPLQRDRPRTPDVTPIVSYLEQRNVPISKPGQVLVPIADEPLKVAFSYVNGAQHFVHAQGFSRSPRQAIDQAKAVGALGRLLHYHSSHQSLRKKLVVFAGVPDHAQVATLRDLLEGMDVRLVDAADADDFAKEVEQTAHPPA